MTKKEKIISLPNISKEKKIIQEPESMREIPKDLGNIASKISELKIEMKNNFYDEQNEIIKIENKNFGPQFLNLKTKVKLILR